jgi:peptidoglycan/xylan/chitin deacetylase (PgdA/CDA1 family)
MTLHKQTMQPARIVTTSWDDGDPKDLRIAEFLHARGIPGTFYVPIQGCQRSRSLGASDLRMLHGAGFEIGGHTVSHRSLNKLRTQEVEYEVRTCKDMLEQLTGDRIRMFCYPNGRYSSEVVKLVKASGYEGARTTRMLLLSSEFYPFEMPTTVQAYPHNRAAYLRNLGRAKNLPGLWNYATELSGLNNWIALGKELFDRVLQRGGIWHLYGHSWEIDELGIWNDLRQMLDYVSRRTGVTYLTNGQLVAYARSAKRDRRHQPAAAARPKAGASRSVKGTN